MKVSQLSWILLSLLLPFAGWAQEGGKANESLYVVPVREPELKSLASFVLKDSGYEFPAAKAEGPDALEIKYTVPEELTGNAPLLRVRLRASVPASVALTGGTFPVSGVMVKGPCRWTNESKADADLPICPSTLDPNAAEVITLAKGRCRWLNSADRSKGAVECRIQYGQLSEIIDGKVRRDFLLEKYKDDPNPKRWEALDSIGILYGHEAVGILTTWPYPIE